MTSVVLVALASLAAGQAEARAPPAENETRIDAQHLSIEQSTGAWRYSGNVVLTATNIEIRADEMSFDPEEQRARARGHVTLLQGSLVGFADEADVRLESGEVTLVGGTILQKRNVTAEALQRAKTREQLENLGTTAMSVSGRHVQKVGPDHFSVDGIAFTPCDCNPVKPSWR